jgi:LL-diaminopimelate aminotransferase
MTKKLIVEKSVKLQKLPPSPFLESLRAKRRLIRRGVDVVDLGELNPDTALRDSIGLSFESSDIFDPADDDIISELKNKISQWLEKRYGVHSNAHKEIYPFFDDKQVIYHLLLGVINPGDKVAIPDPGDPLYKRAAILADAEVESVPLLERNDYLPNLRAAFLSHSAAEGRKSRFRILQNTRSKIPLTGAFPKIIILNYPHDPTTSVADSIFFKEIVKWAGENNILVFNDASGNEICYDDYAPISLLQTKGARKLVAEKFSFFGLTGVDFGFLVGDRGIISCVEAAYLALGRGILKASVLLGLEILKNHTVISKKNNAEYAARKEMMMKGLTQLGWKARKPRCGPYIWVKIPPKYTSVGFARMLLRKTGVLVSPGFGYGEYGEGFIRIALNLPADRIQNALERMKKHTHIWQRRYKPEISEE